MLSCCSCGVMFRVFFMLSCWCGVMFGVFLVLSFCWCGVMFRVFFVLSCCWCGVMFRLFSVLTCCLCVVMFVVFTVCCHACVSCFCAITQVRPCAWGHLVDLFVCHVAGVLSCSWHSLCLVMFVCHGVFVLLHRPGPVLGGTLLICLCVMLLVCCHVCGILCVLSCLCIMLLLCCCTGQPPVRPGAWGHHADSLGH